MRKLAINRNLGEQHGWSQINLMKKIEEGYLLERRGTQVVHKKSFAPSSIGYKHNRCPRKWFYAFSGEVEVVDDNDAISVATMAAGTAAHARIQTAMEKVGLVKELEYELNLVDQDPPIRGFVDCIVDVDGVTVVGEIKTTMQEAFMWRLGKNKGADYHMYQILLYMRKLGFDDGFLLYENKSSNELLVIPIKMDEYNRNAIDEALGWMSMVWGASKKNQFPQRPFTKLSKECKGCEFYKHCWNDERVVDVEIAPMRLAF